MLRVVLVGWSEQDWRLYRQPQWMAEVRRDPAASQHPRHHFDIEEGSFQEALALWEPEKAKASQAGALALLTRLGAIEVGRA